MSCMPNRQGLPCPICGDIITTKRRWTCGNECGKILHHKLTGWKPRPNPKCLVCGKTVKRYRATYCSLKCGVKAQPMRRRELTPCALCGKIVLVPIGSAKHLNRITTCNNKCRLAYDAKYGRPHKEPSKPFMMCDDDIAYADALYTWIEKKGIPKTEVARLSGVPYASVCRITSALGPISYLNYERIVKLTGIQAEGAHPHSHAYKARASVPFTEGTRGLEHHRLNLR